MKLPVSLALYLTTVSAQSVIESISFGYGDKISQSSDSIPGWALKGEGHQPRVLSDKLILTPPDPGHTRGSLWAEKPLSESSWTAEFQFRATGQERGSGNLQLWYVKDGESQVSSSSIYTVGKFDGFVLTFDTHGGRGGSVRGFLNDGSIAYNQHTNVDSLAFGHCDYPYRNLGRPSIVEIKQTSSIFEVIVDQKICFQTPKVVLPSGNVFGLTAATPDNPDSFEIFKFLVTPGPQNSGQTQQQQQVPIRATTNNDETNSINSGALNDINNRLQQLGQDVAQLSQQSDSRHQELLNKVASGSSGSSDSSDSSSSSWQNDARLNEVNDRLKRIENALSGLQRDLEGRDYRNQFTQLHKAIETSHVSLTEALQTSILNMITATTPRMGLFICVVIAFQLVLAGVYIFYKRRRNSMPKKFL